MFLLSQMAWTIIGLVMVMLVVTAFPVEWAGPVFAVSFLVYIVFLAWRILRYE
jgi:hypothetical protein